MPLTNHAAAELKKRTDIAESVEYVSENFVADDNWKVYPQNGNYRWTRDNYGPVWIPKKGEKIDLTLQNLPVYERPISVYEGNDLEVRNGKIFINGQGATT